MLTPTKQQAINLLNVELFALMYSDMMRQHANVREYLIEMIEIVNGLITKPNEPVRHATHDEKMMALTTLSSAFFG